MKRLISVAILTLLLSSCGGSEVLSAEERRNNFDSCKIEFLQQIADNNYKSNKSSFDKQADEGCSPLLQLDKSESENFQPPKPQQKGLSASNELTINIEHGPWTIASDVNADSQEASNLCSKNDNFTYPLGEKIEIFNEKGVVIGVGTVSTFTSAQYRNKQIDDPKYPVEIDLTCKYQGTVDVKKNGNFYRVRIAGTYWNSLAPIDDLVSSNWTLSLNSNDY